jgi:hypothetical protein
MNCADYADMAVIREINAVTRRSFRPNRPFLATDRQWRFNNRLFAAIGYIGIVFSDSSMISWPSVSNGPIFVIVERTMSDP